MCSKIPADVRREYEDTSGAAKPFIIITRAPKTLSLLLLQCSSLVPHVFAYSKSFFPTTIAAKVLQQLLELEPLYLFLRAPVFFLSSP
jgi:hypothetical protein